VRCDRNRVHVAEADHLEFGAHHPGVRAAASSRLRPRPSGVLARVLTLVNPSQPAVNVGGHGEIARRRSAPASAKRTERTIAQTGVRSLPV